MKKKVNSKQIKATSSKPAVAKASKKRSKKSNVVVTRPPLPKDLKYKIKQIPSHPLRFQSVYSPNFSTEIQNSLKEKATKMFKQTIFGPYLDIQQCNLQGQITKCLLLLELDQPITNELHVRHFQGNVLRFSINEFAIITGLKCTGNEDDFCYSEDQPSRLMEKYFPSAYMGVNKIRFFQRFEMGNWDNNDDAVQMAILYFLYNFVFCQPGDVLVTLDHFKLVEDDRYIQFPWGKVAFQILMSSLRHEFTSDKQMYRLSGLPFALNVWMYECASHVQPDIAVKNGNKIPRILNWSVVGIKPKFETFMSTMFSEQKCTNIVPTQQEIDAFDLPFLQDSTHKSPPPLFEQSSCANNAQARSDDLIGFEDFTTAPPEHLLRRSKRAGGTSSPPPPKKQKNVHKKKLTAGDVDAQEKPVQCTEASKKAGTTSRHVEDHFDGPPSSSVQTEKMGKQTVKKLKKFLKTYIKKKFSRLEAKIDANHLEIMKSIGKEVNRSSKVCTPGDDSDKSLHTVESHQTDHVLEQLKNNEGDITIHNVEATVNDSEDVNGSKVLDNADVSEDVEVAPTKATNEYFPVQEAIASKSSFVDKPNDQQPMDDINDNAQISEKVGVQDSKQAEGLTKIIDIPTVNVIPLKAVNQEGLPELIDLTPVNVNTNELTGKEIILHGDTKTPIPVRRIRNPSKVFKSPYLIKFGSSEKGKEKIEQTVCQTHPFEGFAISEPLPYELMEDYVVWIKNGLLRNHANKKLKEEHYRAKSSGLGVDMMDFVVATPKNKNWFYVMSQRDFCWNDQHIDVVFYYLRKKSKDRMSNQYRYTTTDCLFKAYISGAYDRYYNVPSDRIISTQEDIALGAVVANLERSLYNTIKGYGIPAGLPWHQVDEVYIPINSDGQFHWVLAVVVLKSRLIRVYDSSMPSRKRKPSGEIKKLSIMLPVYLQDSGFYEQKIRNDWSSLDAYKDKQSGSLLGPEHPFKVEFVQDIAQQEPATLDCGLYVAIFAKYLSDQIAISSVGLDTDEI